MLLITNQLRTIKCENPPPRLLRVRIGDEVTKENCSAAEKTVFGPEGRRMQAGVWKEILVVLTERMPELKSLGRYTMMTNVA
jgi:hypothetical protein